MSLVTLIRYLPYFIELWRAVQERIEKSQTERKVHEDLTAITKAFNEKDARHLDHIFNDGLPVEPEK